MSSGRLFDKSGFIGVTMDIEYRKITEFPRGSLAALLKDGYSFEPRFEKYWENQSADS